MLSNTGGIWNRGDGGGLGGDDWPGASGPARREGTPVVRIARRAIPAAHGVGAAGDRRIGAHDGAATTGHHRHRPEAPPALRPRLGRHLLHHPISSCWMRRARGQPRDSSGWPVADRGGRRGGDRRPRGTGGVLAHRAELPSRPTRLSKPGERNERSLPPGILELLGQLRIRSAPSWSRRHAGLPCACHGPGEFCFSDHGVTYRQGRPRGPSPMRPIRGRQFADLRPAPDGPRRGARAVNPASNPARPVAIRPTPASSAAESFQRSWAWNWSSGRRSLRAMQRKVPAEKARVSDVTRAGRRRASQRQAQADPEDRRTQGDHHREAEVDQVRPEPGDAGPEHQADDRQGVGRLVDQGGDEDPQGARPQPPVGPDGAGQRDPAGQRCAGPGRRPRPPSAARSPWSPTPGPGAEASTTPAEWPRPSWPCSCGVGWAGLGRVGGGLVVVEGEEPFQEEQGRAGRRPTSSGPRPSPGGPPRASCGRTPRRASRRPRS